MRRWGTLGRRVAAAGDDSVGIPFDPEPAAWPDAGVYQLWIDVRRPMRVRIGALGTLPFVMGTYVYTGRAARGLRARVRRHALGAPRLRWHIDYLLAHPGVRVRKIVLVSPNASDECRVNRRGAVQWIAVPRFGASDCRAGCPGHLWQTTDGPCPLRKPGLNTLSRRPTM